MLKKLILKNWKTHKNTELEFQKGVNVLIGIMGAGKSSVLDAISFALFGTFPQLNSKRTSLQNLITDRPQKEESAEVSLIFTVGNDEYKVTRVISKKESDAKLEKNGSYIQSQSKKVTSEIEHLLKIDYDIFSKVIYSEQNGLDYFLNLTGGERKRVIDNMLGLDSFATAESYTTTLINNIGKSIEYIEKNIASINESEIYTSLEKLNDEVTTLKKELNNYINIEKSAAEKLKIHEEELKMLKSKIDEKRKLNDEVSKLQGSINILNKELEALKSKNINKEDLLNKYNIIKNEMNKAKSDEIEIRSKMENISGRKGELENKILTNKKKIVEKKAIEELLSKYDINKIQKDLENNTEELNNASGLINSSLNRIKELEESLKELKNAEGKCPVCDRPLDEEHKAKLIDEKLNISKELNNIIEKNREIVKQKNVNIKILNEKIKELEVKRSRLSDYNGIEKIVEDDEKQLKDIKEEKEKFEQSYKEISLKIEKLNDSKHDIELKLKDVEKIDQYEKDLNKSRSILNEKTSKLNSIEVDDSKIYALQELIKKDSVEVAEIRTKLDSNKKYIKDKESQIEDKNKQIKILNEQKAAIRKNQELVAELNKFKTSIINTEASLRSKLVSSINELMLQLWPRLYPYKDYSAVRLTADVNDYLLEVNTSSNNTWVQVDGIASGGERSIACLILRIALAMVIVPNLRWIILDEPTHNIDSNGISKLIDVFGNELPNIVEQVFIITHDDLLKQINLAKIYVLDRDKSKSAHTTVTTL
ncbi:MAG: AAA family ATPase [Candidatus Micrarchaeia archaeon]